MRLGSQAERPSDSVYYLSKGIDYSESFYTEYQ